MIQSTEAKYTTETLGELRRRAHLSQDQAANAFGLTGTRRRYSVAQWESNENPPGIEHRIHFILYLWYSLNLRDNPARFRKVWVDVMVGQWNWRPLDEADLCDAFGNDIPDVLGPAPHPATVPARPLPPSLTSPPTPPSGVFQNRADELKVLIGHLQTQRVACIIGMGGIGKTVLASALVEQRPNQVPLPLWFDFSLESDVNLARLLDRITSYLDFLMAHTIQNPSQELGRADIDPLLARLSKSAPLWLVLDNFESLLDRQGRLCDADLDFFLQKLLQRQSEIRLIVCSRRLPLLCNAGPARSAFSRPTVALKGLSGQDGINFLRQDGLLEADESLLTRLVEKVDGHPQALELLSREAKRWGAEKVLNDSRLWQKTPRAEAFVRKLFAALPLDERRLLMHLSVFRRPQPPNILVELAGGGTSGEQAFISLDEKAWLAPHQGAGVLLYRLHPLIQELAALALKNPVQRQQAHQMAYHIYRQVELPPTYQWHYRQDITPLIEAHFHAIQAKRRDLAAAILIEYNLPDHLERWGYQDQLIRLCQDTFGDVPEAVSYASVGYDRFQSQDVPKITRAYLCRQVGKCARYLDQYERASKYYEQGIKLLGEETDIRELVLLYRESAFVLQRLGRRAEALERCLYGLKLLNGVVDREGLIDKATLHVRAGVILLEEGEALAGWLTQNTHASPDSSLDESADARAKRSEVQDRLQNALADALTNFEQAHTIYEKAELTALEHEAYDNIGLVHRAQGQYLETQGQYEDSQGRHEAALARHNEAQSQYQAALAIFTQVQKYFEKIDYRAGSAHTKVNIGDVLCCLGCYQEARPYQEDILHWFREISDQQGEVISLYNLGELELKTDHYRAAIDYLEQGLKVAKRIGDEQNRKDILTLLDEAYGRMGRSNPHRQEPGNIRQYATHVNKTQDKSSP